MILLEKINRACGIAELAKTNIELKPDEVRYMLSTIAQLSRACYAASCALKSYQYGNCSTELAKETSKFCDDAIAATEGGE